MDYGTITLSDLKKGYYYDEETQSFRCNYCTEVFPVGQVFAIGEDFYDAKHAAEKHVETAHGGSFEHLIHSDTKYLTLTDTQKELLSLFHAGVSDKEIAQSMGVSASTVRHQKFTFREKAKRAKVYLALYEEAFKTQSSDENTIVPLHDTATMVDSRYVTTKKEQDKILASTFESFEPLRLKVFPYKPKKHIVVLRRIAEEIEPGRRYTEGELKELLKPIYEDHSLVRRLLVDYGFVDRTNDGSEYWLK